MKTRRLVTLAQLLEERPVLVASGKFPDRYVRELVATRRIPYYNPTGGRLMFDLTEVDEFIEASRVAPSRATTPLPSGKRVRTA